MSSPALKLSSTGLAVLALLFFGAGLFTGVGLTFVGPQNEFSNMTDVEITIDLQYYRGMLHNASGAGCQMSISDFRRYHALSNELEGRDSN